MQFHEDRSYENLFQDEGELGEPEIKDVELKIWSNEVKVTVDITKDNRRL